VVAGNPPLERFEIGEIHDNATYRGISLDTAIEIGPYPEDATNPAKRRTVRIIARDGEKQIADEATTEDVGSLDRRIGEDYEHARSNSAHVASVADDLKDDIDEYLATGVADAEIRAGLEAGFDDDLRTKPNTAEEESA
jgi:hypothetical protein